MTQATVALLERAGVIKVFPDLLPGEVAQQIACGYAKIEQGEPATVFLGEDPAEQVDEQVRRTLVIPMGSAAVDGVADCISQHIDDIAGFLDVDRSISTEPLVFLRYTEGAHFAPHRDGRPAEQGDHHVHRRCGSAVLFLGRDAESGPAYEGGHLSFAGTEVDERLTDKWFDITCPAGTLVVFRASALHRVSEVRSGERRTMVTWFR